MIKIIKDSDICTVTRGAYESFYKPLGFSIVDNKDKPKKIEENKNENDKEHVENKSTQEPKQDKVTNKPDDNKSKRK